jgi:hypothetical protein
MQPHYTPGLEYFAGYFDGEGCITMRSVRSANSYRLTIQATTGCLPVLTAIKSRFGGRVKANAWIDKRPIKTNRQLYLWNLNGIQECHDFLQAIQPFSIEKRPQIDVALTWLKHRLTFPVRAFTHHFDRDLAQSTCEALRVLKKPSL